MLWFIACAALILATCTAHECNGQTYTPYSYFQSLSVGDMGRVQSKITFMGLQNVPVATIAFAVQGNTMNLGLFTPFQRLGFDYGNDRFAEKSFSASAQELSAMIDSVATVPEVACGAAESAAIISFALLDTLDGTPRVFESIVGSRTAQKLFAKLLAVFKNNARASSDLRLFGCSEGILPNDPPASVDGRVSVRFSGVRADRAAKGQFIGRVRMTNTSGTTISAPVTLLIVVGGSADLIGADGHSCRTNLSGHPFVILAPTVGLAPGATIERVLRFANPSLEKFNTSFHVFSGLGTM
jgi:hypothetical protein